MLETQQSHQQLSTSLAAKGDELDQIHRLYLSEGKMWFYIGIAAASLTFLAFLSGLIVWLAGVASQGWIASVASSAPGVLSALFFNQAKEANKKIEELRINLEKRQEEERKKEEQEGQEERKRQERQQEEERKKRERQQEEEQREKECEQRELSIMLKLEAFYKLASKTDYDDHKEEYYQDIFGQVEYNKWRVEAYFNTISSIEDESKKRAFFREMFRSLLTE